MKKIFNRKLFSKIKYRHKVAAVIFLFILLPLLILSMFIVKKSWDERVESILEKNRSELRIGVETVNTFFLSTVQKLSFINNNFTIISYLKKENFSDFVNNMEVYDSMTKIIDALRIDSPDINFIIYPINRNAYSGNYIENIERLEIRLGQDVNGLMQQILTLKWDETVWIYEKEEKAGVLDGDMGYICCYIRMQSLDKTLAITQVSINTDKILRFIEGNYPNGSCIAFKPDINSDEIVIKKIQSDAITGENTWNIVSDSAMLSEQKYYSIEMQPNISSVKFTAFIPRSYIFSELRGFLLMECFIVIMSIFILFLIIELASYLINRRLARLIDRVNMNIENTNAEYVTDRHLMEDDLGQMEDKIYDMLGKIRGFYKSMLEHENEKKAFELELLQSRINPHFLYNTLSTMKWSCNSKKMADIIDSMVAYYRLALNKGDSIVNISQELKLVEEYLKIQKYTYESDFIYTFDVDEEVMNFLTVRHLLQPVVENAVLHGINGLESGGIIKIAGKLKESSITLTVTDNGVGMTEEKVKQLLCGDYKSKTGGYGIKNVMRRIFLFYGPNSALQITSEPYKGTTITINIPIVYPKNPANYKKDEKR